MPEIFLGDLSQVKLFDILKPLLMGKKTGKLSFKGKENGEMYLEIGNIVHAKTPNSFGEYGFFTIMGWKMGRITFEPDQLPPERTISIPSEQLLLNWSSKKMEWERIEKQSLPTMLFSVSPFRKMGKINILALIDGIY